MAAIRKSTGRQTQVQMGGRRQKRSEKTESGKMARPGPRWTELEGNCWESQDSSRVVALMKKERRISTNSFGRADPKLTSRNLASYI